MTNISLDLSENRELVRTADALRIIAEAAKELDISWFVVGATARDMILSSGYGLSTSRMTRDVDVAVNVSTWADYQALRARLLAHSDIRPTAVPHRLEFRGTVVLDIVPFGRIEKDGTIEWPNEDRQMNVTGFKQASEKALQVSLPGGVVASVVSLPGLLLLELIAWNDRHVREPRHDGPDIRDVLMSYGESWNVDRLYEEGEGFLETFSYEPTIAGAALLGIELRQLVDDRSEKVITTEFQRSPGITFSSFAAAS